MQPIAGSRKVTAKIDVWRVCLDVPAADRRRLGALLSLAEQDRAARFRTQQLRNRYTVAHGALRHILANYLGLAPTEILIEAESSGKPVLSARHGPARPHFNLSHSDSAALIAVSEAGPVGIDIERRCRNLDIEALATRCFGPDEARQIVSLPGQLREQAFLNCWTRKEAYLKATGAGLSVPLDSFEVTVMPGIPPRLVRTADDRSAAASWSLFDLSHGDFAAALAIEGSRPRLQIRKFRSVLD